MNAETLLHIWQIAGRVGSPFLHWHFKRQAKLGHEDAARIEERFGHSSLPRPRGLLLWVHASSVGEALSALALIEGMKRLRPDVEILVTSSTMTAAQLLSGRLPEGSAHQYAPIDAPAVVKRFLNFWEPDAAVFVESELWPGYITALHDRKVPLALVSARISERSARRWAKFGGLGRALFGRIRLILAQTQSIAERFAQAGAEPSQIRLGGALKDAAQPLPVDKDELQQMRQHLGLRPRWLAASTHAGEETAAFDAHRELRQRWPDMLTIIAPRHPVRTDELAEQAAARGLKLVRRSQQPVPPTDGDIMLVDRLGELGLWYRVCPISFIGGTLVPVGGHNPLEAARLGCAIVHGPHVHSAVDAYLRLSEAHGAQAMALGDTLAGVVSQLLSPDGTPNERAQQLAEAAFAASVDGQEILLRTLDAVNDLLPAAHADHVARPGKPQPTSGVR